MVSRDCGGEYAEAAKRAAPHVVQVADRFHLLKNVRDVVSRVFRHHEEVLDLVPSPAHHVQRLTNLRLDRKASKERTRREKTRELFEGIGAPGKPLPDRPPGILASHAAGILLKRPENRSEREIQTLKRLKSVQRVTERCCTLFEQFAEMIRDEEETSEEQVHG